MSVIISGKLVINNNLVFTGKFVQIKTLELLKKHYPNYKSFKTIEGKFDDLTLEKDVILCLEPLDNTNKVGEIITSGNVTLLNHIVIEE